MLSQNLVAQHTRDAILKLLSDEEVARVSSAEEQTRLAHGEEYVDLEHLDRGIRRALGTTIDMGRLLSRNSVKEKTWNNIVTVLAAAQDSH